MSVGSTIASIPVNPVGIMAGKAVTKVVKRCQHAEEEENLDLSECQLMSIPDAVYHLMRNTVILACDLSSNVLRKIPPKFALKFTYITDLNLANNRLSSLPEELCDLRDLRRLDISQNDYMLFPKVVFKLSNLIYLNAQKNHITSIDVDKLKSIRSLREVNFEDNPLTNASREQLKSMESVVVTVLVNSPVDEDSDDDIMNLENVSPSGSENKE
ncbi:leucine-rich repeat-containing protein 40-like [Tachypleus tridentatus]|uniref:leucine-rich repeat-containing protein 40-like n=1 Tax=Tachypleus tridentatus TaxID=6853 RepID=UPI003FD163DA